MSYELNWRAGAIEIGILANAVLLGMVQIQCYYYYSRFPDDKVPLKALVAVVWIFDMAQAWTVFIPLYKYTIKGYGNPALILEPPPSFWLTMSFGGASTTLIQSFLAFRVYRVVNLLSVAIISWFLTLVRLMGCLSVTITGYHTLSLPLYKEQFGWLWDTVLSIGIANDLLVTGGLTFSLYKYKKKGHSRTSLVIDKLIVWILGLSPFSSIYSTSQSVKETASLTVIVNSLILVFYHVFPNAFIWIGMYCVSPKLFTLSLLSILNGRESLRYHMETSGPDSSLGENSLSSRVQQTRLDINITRVQQIDYGFGNSEINNVYSANFKHED
ncbi:hypothetical protein DL96DRAFT_1706314 [Flagelloscypha sp. PMI_526]|nr:hypothetical protein DL96DRAFT_1706314 [Flagelloscypha sp. PMI_526]